MATRAARMFAALEQRYAADRCAPSGVQVELHNPGTKLCLYLGRPIKTRRYNAQEHEQWPAAAMLDSEGMKCCVCTFDLPLDWVQVDDDSHPHYRIVARQLGSDPDRFVAVTKQSGVPMSEVHN